MLEIAARALATFVVLSTLDEIYPGLGKATAATMGAASHHTGGFVGSHAATRNVSPLLFAGAPRYHVGGVVGLAPGEVPIIAKEGERILTQAEDKALGKTLAGHGATPAADPKVKVINGIDSASFLEAALASPQGEKVILNWLRANSNAVSGSRG